MLLVSVIDADCKDLYAIEANVNDFQEKKRYYYVKINLFDIVTYNRLNWLIISSAIHSIRI